MSRHEEFVAQMRAAIAEQGAELQTELVTAPQHRRPDLVVGLAGMHELAESFAIDAALRMGANCSANKTLH